MSETALDIARKQHEGYVRMNRVWRAMKPEYDAAMAKLWERIKEQLPPSSAA